MSFEFHSSSLDSFSKKSLAESTYIPLTRELNNLPTEQLEVVKKCLKTRHKCSIDMIEKVSIWEAYQINSELECQKIEIKLDKIDRFPCNPMIDEQLSELSKKYTLTKESLKMGKDQSYLSRFSTADFWKTDANTVNEHFKQTHKFAYDVIDYSRIFRSACDEADKRIKQKKITPTKNVASTKKRPHSGSADGQPDPTAARKKIKIDIPPVSDIPIAPIPQQASLTAAQIVNSDDTAGSTPPPVDPPFVPADFEEVWNWVCSIDET